MELPLRRFGAFVAERLQPLGIGSLELADGCCVKGAIRGPDATPEGEDSSAFGGWRAYLHHARA